MKKWRWTFNVVVGRQMPQALREEGIGPTAYIRLLGGDYETVLLVAIPPGDGTGVPLQGNLNADSRSRTVEI